jgi:hypothetical protein
VVAGGAAPPASESSSAPVAAIAAGVAVGVGAHRLCFQAAALLVLRACWGATAARPALRRDTTRLAAHASSPHPSPAVAALVLAFFAWRPRKGWLRRKGPAPGPATGGLESGSGGGDDIVDSLIVPSVKGDLLASQPTSMLIPAAPASLPATAGSDPGSLPASDVAPAAAAAGAGPAAVVPDPYFSGTSR